MRPPKTSSSRGASVASLEGEEVLQRSRKTERGKGLKPLARASGRGSSRYTQPSPASLRSAALPRKRERGKGLKPSPAPAGEGEGHKTPRPASGRGGRA